MDDLKERADRVKAIIASADSTNPPSDDEGKELLDTGIDVIVELLTTGRRIAKALEDIAFGVLTIEERGRN